MYSAIQKHGSVSALKDGQSIIYIMLFYAKTEYISYNKHFMWSEVYLTSPANEVGPPNIKNKKITIAIRLMIVWWCLVVYYRRLIESYNQKYQKKTRAWN